MNTPHPRPATLRFSGLFRQLKEQTKAFVQQEYRLAKTELGEKGSRLRRHGALIAAAALVAYAACIVLMMAVGLLIAYALAQFAWHPLLTLCVGLGGISMFLLIASGIVAWGALRRLQTPTLKPEKTLDTLKAIGSPELRDSRSSPPMGSTTQLEWNVVAAERDIGQTIREIRRRVTPEYLRCRAEEEVSEHPLRWSLIAAATGLLAGSLLRRMLF